VGCVLFKFINVRRRNLKELRTDIEECFEIGFSFLFGTIIKHDDHYDRLKKARHDQSSPTGGEKNANVHFHLA
jgi:hypothetical protein